MSSDPLFLRSVELLLIVLGGILFGYLGYRLFIFGVREGQSHFEAQSTIVRVVFSGTAPGLFFMFAGAAILAIAIVVKATDSAVTQTTKTTEEIPLSVTSAAPSVTPSVAVSTSTEFDASVVGTTGTAMSPGATLKKTTTTITERHETKKSKK